VLSAEEKDDEAESASFHHLKNDLNGEKWQKSRGPSSSSAKSIHLSFFCLVPCCFGDQVFSELTLLLVSKDAPVYNNSTENPPSSVVVSSSNHR
jgi:hypothetical protein